MLSKKGHAFLRPLKKKGFKEARVTRMRRDNLSTSTTLESHKSQAGLLAQRLTRGVRHMFRRRLL
jgi:hypothetical protein